MDKFADKYSTSKGVADSDVAALEELRSLLFARERARIDALEKRLDSPEIFVDDVERVLPEAFRLRSSHDDDLTRVLEPSIEAGLRSSIKKDPKALADVLFPIMGPAIRKSIISILLSMTQAVNKVVEHSFSIQGVKWRLEAIKAKKSFAEIVLLKTLKYQVEQIFLVHKETGLVLQHVVADDVISQDPDLVAGMLTAIQDFVTDSFVSETQEDLDALRIGGDRTVWIERGADAVLVMVIRGTPPVDLRDVFSEMTHTVHRQQAQALECFDGDVAPFEAVHDQLKSGLVSEVKEKKRQFSPFLWILLACAIFAIGFWLFTSNRVHSRWSSFLGLLHGTPGVIITTVEKKSGQYHIYGLIDARAQVPENLLKEVKLEPGSVVFHWEPYVSLHPKFFSVRVNHVFSPPQAVVLEVKGDTLYARGVTFSDWIKRARQKAASFPGVTHYNDEKLIDVGAAMNPPKTVILEMKGDVLYARGTASGEWIEQARQKAASFSSTVRYDDEELVDIDPLIQMKDKVERQLFYFNSGKHEMASGQEQKLRGLLKDMQEVYDLSHIAKKVVKVEVIGHTDSRGGDSFNIKLGKRRAEYFFKLLIDQGLEKDKFMVTYLSAVSAKRSNIIIKEQRFVNLKLTIAVD